MILGIIGFVVGFVVGALVFRKNKQHAEQLLDEAKNKLNIK